MTYFDLRWLLHGSPDDPPVEPIRVTVTEYPTWIDETHIFQDIMEPIRVTAERADWLNKIAGKPAITDGVLRPDRVLYTWPMILKRARGMFEQQLFRAHGPQVKVQRGLPWCEFCECVWPCPNAEEILLHFGLTEHDFDFRPEDNVSDE